MPILQPIVPKLIPLGDRSLLVRFADGLDIDANIAAIGLARVLTRHNIKGVAEVAPNLVSVLVRYDPGVISWSELCGEIRLALGQGTGQAPESRIHTVPIHYGGEDGPDLLAVSEALGMEPDAFIAAHGAAPLRVLAVGFAPGFLYGGMHPQALIVPRRTAVRARVPVGSVLFAAGQTAITATPLPTGWSVIGRTDLANFDMERDPPVEIVAGDRIAFEAVP